MGSAFEGQYGLSFPFSKTMHLESQSGRIAVKIHRKGCRAQDAARGTKAEFLCFSPIAQESNFGFCSLSQCESVA